MVLWNAFDKKRAERLADRAYELLDEGELEEVLAMAEDLEELRHSAAFDLAAQVRARLGDLPAAIEILERGLEIAPDAWANWQLLGNLKSDQGKYREAKRCYRRALKCPGVWEASIRLNEAILLNRQEKYEEALDGLEEIEDEELGLPVAEAAMHALLELGRSDEAVEAGQVALEESAGDPDVEIAVRVGTLLERTRFERGASRPSVRRNALALLTRDPRNEETLALIRDTYGLYSATSRYFRLLIGGARSEGEGSRGFFVTYDVVADSPEGAMRFVRELEALCGHTDLSIEASEALEARPTEPQGVYQRTGWVYHLDNGDGDGS